MENALDDLPRKVNQLDDDVHAIYDMLQTISVTQQRQGNRLQEIIIAQEDHGTRLDEHTMKLDKHTKILDQHTKTLAEHTKRFDHVDERLGHIVGLLEQR